MHEFPTEAVQFVRKLRGSSHSVLTRCSDDHYYVVKFTNNPNGLTALKREVITTRLARRLSLPVPDYSFVYVSDWLLAHTPEIVGQDAKC